MMHRQRLIGLALAATLGGCTLAGTGPSPLQEGGALQEPESPDWTALALARLPALERCAWPNVEETLLCGSLVVPEDRSLAAGRSLSLDIVVVAAHNAWAPNDAVFLGRSPATIGSPSCNWPS